MTKKKDTEQCVKCKDCGKEMTKYDYYQYSGLPNNHGGLITPPRILCSGCFEKQARIDELFTIKDSINNLKNEVRLNMQNYERHIHKDVIVGTPASILFIILQLAILWLTYYIF